MIKYFKGKELKNNCVHFVLGFFMTFLTIGLVAILYNLYLPKIALMTTLVMSVTVEICQFLYNDQHEWKAIERSIEIACYFIGATTMILIIKNIAGM
jgi:hypothetical protein